MVFTTGHRLVTPKGGGGGVVWGPGQPQPIHPPNHPPSHPHHMPRQATRQHIPQNTRAHGTAATPTLSPPISTGPAACTKPQTTFSIGLEPQKRWFQQTTQECENTGSACLDKPVLGQGGGGFGMTPWCVVLVCSWRRLLADRHSLPFPWTLSLRRRWCPSASHHPLTFLFLLALTIPLPSPFPSLGLSLRRPQCPSASPHSFPSLSLGQLCQRSPRTRGGHKPGAGCPPHSVIASSRGTGFRGQCPRGRVFRGSA